MAGRVNPVPGASIGGCMSTLDPARVMLAFTHTHSGPSLCREDADKPGGDLIAPYLEKVRAALILAVRRALDSASPATLAWGQGKCTLAILDSKLAPTTSAVDRIELDAERHRRVAHQLDRQSGLHTLCMQRAAVQGAILHELSVSSETLARRLDFEAAMEEILAHCLDGAGLPKGALYLFKQGHLHLGAQYGLGDTLLAAQHMFEEAALCEQIAV